jgi:integrase
MFDGTGRWVSSEYSKKEDAVNWEERQLRLMRTQTPTLAEFSKDFFMRTDRQSYRELCRRKNREHPADHYQRMQGRLENHILPVFGRRRLSDITQYEIDEWFVCLRKVYGKDEELADDSKNKVLSCLSEVMDEAVRLGYLKDNPCKKVQKILARGVPREIFDEEEMAALFPENDAKAVWVWRSLRRGNCHPELKGVYTTSSVNSAMRKVVNRIKTTGSGKEYKVGLLSDQCCRLLDRYIASFPPEHLGEQGDDLPAVDDVLVGQHLRAAVHPRCRGRDRAPLPLPLVPRGDHGLALVAALHVLVDEPQLVGGEVRKVCPFHKKPPAVNGRGLGLTETAER